MREDIARAITQKNLRGLMQLLFEGNPPTLRLQHPLKSELWDLRRDVPPPRGKEYESEWALLAADILAFHNLRGGVIVFGFDRYNFVGATAVLDNKKFNDRIRRYLPDNIFVEYDREYIQDDQRYLGVALIPPRGPVLARFRTNGPLLNGRRAFEKLGTALRENEATRILAPREAQELQSKLQVPIVGNTLAINEPFFRVLAPDYQEFIYRQKLCNSTESSIYDPRTSTTSLVGIGGVGKTAVATWATLRAFESQRFDFIVSVTAKDRELTSLGITGLRPALTSFDTLLDEILDVLDFPDLKQLETKPKEDQVRLLLSSAKGLLYVDNLETVDDARIIRFLDDLPLGTRAIVTSRRSRVRVAARPIEVAPMDEPEVLQFVHMLCEQPAFGHVAGMSNSEILRVSKAWDGIPLAIRWSLSRVSSVTDAITTAEQAALSRRHGDELLEFSFRRVFDGLTGVERLVLQTLSVLQQPIPIEALFVGTGEPDTKVLDAVDELVEDSIVLRVFDSALNDYSYTVLPITRAFVRRDLRRDRSLANRLTMALSNWFEARDIRNEEQRVVVREIRQGGRAGDAALLDLALAAERRRDFDGAEKLYKQALARAPQSWNAARRYADFLVHRRGDRFEALRFCAQAAANAPSRGPDRALIYREWGLLLKDSGEPNAASLAVEKLRVAVEATPNDSVAVTALAKILDQMGSYREVIRLLEPYIENGLPSRWRTDLQSLLLRAYDRTNELLKAAELRAEMMKSIDDTAVDAD